MPYHRWSFRSVLTILLATGCGEPTEPRVPTSLGYNVQPSQVAAGSVIAPAVKVAVFDQHGIQILTANYIISIAIGSEAEGGGLSGTTTVTAENGQATFSDLIIDAPGTGYTLVATSTGLASVTSNSFVVSAAAALTPVR
jgi:hypothetical protein